MIFNAVFRSSPLFSTDFDGYPDSDFERTLADHMLGAESIPETAKRLHQEAMVKLK